VRISQSFICSPINYLEPQSVSLTISEICGGLMYHPKNYYRINSLQMLDYVSSRHGFEQIHNTEILEGIFRTYIDIKDPSIISLILYLK